ncbi:MAG: hypothetical protein AAFU65_05775, partial [Pseudomonadota bacterium]
PAGQATQDVPVAQLFDAQDGYNGLIGREVTYDGRSWTYDGYVSDDGQTRYQLVDPSNASNRVFVPIEDSAQITFGGDAGGQYSFADVRHEVVRIRPEGGTQTVTAQLEPGQSFEARLVGRELEGVYTVTVGEDGTLTAVGNERSGAEVSLPISASDIAPRYTETYSPDFDATFDVDTFVHQESVQSTRALTTEPTGRPIRDPQLGTLEKGVMANLTRGPETSQTVANFIETNSANVPDGETPKLTLFNIAFRDEGEASDIFDAVSSFRDMHGPDAEITVVMDQSRFLPPRDGDAVDRVMNQLEDIGADVQFFRGEEGGQVIHAKGAIVNDEVLFSTGAFIGYSDSKADVTVELPDGAARSFSNYVDAAVTGDATVAERQAMAADLASQGVLVNDPVAGVAYISRAQDALITGANETLLVSVSELTNPDTALSIADAAARGVDVTVQYRDIDPVSANILKQAQEDFGNLKLEDVSDWTPRPHYNVVVADDTQAYVGTAYLWPNQDSMVQHARSFENGVILDGGAASDLATQIEMLSQTQPQ